MWMAFALRPCTVATLAEVTRRARARIADGTYLQWRIWTADRRLLFGSIDVNSLDWDVPKGEIGYWLRADAVGQGLAAEAVRCVLDHLLHDCSFARIEARCDSRNERAILFAERLGFVREGVACNSTRNVRGELADEMVLSVGRHAPLALVCNKIAGTEAG